MRADKDMSGARTQIGRWRLWSDITCALAEGSYVHHTGGVSWEIIHDHARNQKSATSTGKSDSYLNCQIAYFILESLKRLILREREREK